MSPEGGEPGDEPETVRFDPADYSEGSTAESAGQESAPSGDPRARSPGEESTFGPGGWGLVVALFFAFGIIPMTIFYIPRAQGLLTAVGLGYRDAFLVLPLVPALVLGVLAVWVTARD
jgi:hypothetical protein